VHSFLNPLLVQVMAQGYLFNCYRNAPLVKKGGTMIITHPCTDRSTRSTTRRTSSSSTTCSPRRATPIELHKKYEAKFASNPAYIQMYRTGARLPPGHPFFMWYWGEAGAAVARAVIVVGADNAYVPKLLGWETARR
jgi:hypothetical protein